MNIEHAIKQSTEESNRRVMNWVLVPLSFVLVLMTGYVSAGSYFGGHGMIGGGMGKQGMLHPLERMLDHIYLTDQQEIEVAVIVEKFKTEDGIRTGFSVMKEIVSISPEDASYNEQVSQQAELAAQRIKQKIVDLAEARKEIYSILSEEQKQELNDLIERKMRRMEKRMSQRD